MTGRTVGALAALVLVSGAAPGAGPAPRQPSGERTQRHHYAIAARIRPLLLFWIGRSDIGDAVVTERQGPEGAGYSLLIGSDPERAPRRINRWGYIDEQIHGGNATLIGLMTESDESSIEEAEAAIRAHAGDHIFQIIRATVDGDQARSSVSSIAIPADYTFRQVRGVLDLAARGPAEGTTRVVRLPPGTRPGFLAALAELVHAHVDQWRSSGQIRDCGRIRYVYHGRIYELSATRTQALPSVRVGAIDYAHVIASQFEIRNTHDGGRTAFSMTYGTEGRFEETTLTASFQPRWWLQIELALDDTRAGSAAAGALNP